MDDCAAAGVKSLVIISAGFAEAGERGRALQRELVERVRNHGMRMVGPNCMGLLNATANVRLNASFSPIMPPSGTVSLLSQSGALGIAILELATERHLGLSTFVSVGNKADVSSNDLLQYWDGDATDIRHPLVSRVVRKPTAVFPHRQTHRPQQADRRGKSRTHAGRFASGSAATPLPWPRAMSRSMHCFSKPA